LLVPRAVQREIDRLKEWKDRDRHGILRILAGNHIASLEVRFARYQAGEHVRPPGG
jgi:hypothetical protein